MRAMRSPKRRTTRSTRKTGDRSPRRKGHLHNAGALSGLLEAL
jgi:hypothetical protein